MSDTGLAIDEPGAILACALISAVAAWRTHGNVDRFVDEAREAVQSRVCAVPGCTRVFESRGLCKGHYKRSRVLAGIEMTTQLKRQIESLDAATDKGKRWTSKEMEFLSNSELTDKEIANLLHRTIYGVRTKRKKIRDSERAEVAS